MKMVQFNLTQFSKALFNYLQQTQQLPNHFLILEDLKAQDMFIHKTAVFEPQKTGPMLVFQASPTYYGQPCYDAVSYLLNEQTHFGLVEVIFTFNVSSPKKPFTLWSSIRSQICLQCAQTSVLSMRSNISFAHWLFPPNLILRRSLMTEKKKHWPVVIEEEPCERPSTKEKIPQKTQRFSFFSDHFPHFLSPCERFPWNPPMHFSLATSL